MTQPRIVFSRDAEKDLASLFDYIADESGLNRAAAVLNEIDETIGLLAVLPGGGRIPRDLTGSPHAFAVWPWLTIYDILPTGDGIHVLRVIDGRRDLPRHV